MECRCKMLDNLEDALNFIQSSGQAWTDLSWDLVHSRVVLYDRHAGAEFSLKRPDNVAENASELIGAILRLSKKLEPKEREWRPGDVVVEKEGGRLGIISAMDRYSHGYFYLLATRHKPKIYNPAFYRNLTIG